MELSTAAMGFAAMGSEARLEVLQILVRAGQTGLTVGDIQERTSIPGSTLNHHLKSLSTSGLIRQEKDGRIIINRANFDHLRELAAYILDKCCVDETISGEHQMAQEKEAHHE